MQKAIFVTEVGKPLTLGTRPIPVPPKGFVQIRVRATQLLPHDTYGRDSGLFFGDRLPFILGTNIAGTVTALNPDTPNPYNIGEEIFGLGSPIHPVPDLSGLQEYALLIVEASAEIPQGFTAEQVATLPVNSVTSFSALFHPEHGFGFPLPWTIPAPTPLKNTTVVIIGAGSNVGKIGIQFAVLAGVGTIIVVAAARNEETLKKLGATYVVDRHLTPEKIREAVHAITPQEQLTHVYDCVSWEFSLGVSLLSREARSMLLVLHPAETGVELAKQEGLEGKADVKFVIGNTAFFAPLTGKFWEHLPGWVEGGKVEVPAFRVVEGLDIQKVEEGLDSYRDGSPVVPFVVKVQGKA